MIDERDKTFHCPKCFLDNAKKFAKSKKYLLILPEQIYILPWVDSEKEQNWVPFLRINEHDDFPDFSSLCKISDKKYIMSGGIPNAFSIE